MDIKSFFSTKTRRGRAVRTALQTFMGIVTFLGGLLTLPGFAELLTDGGIAVQASTFAAWVGVVSYIQNALESLITYLWGK